MNVEHALGGAKPQIDIGYLKDLSRPMTDRDIEILKGLGDQSWYENMMAAENKDPGPVCIGYSHDLGMFILVGETLAWTSLD